MYIGVPVWYNKPFICKDSIPPLALKRSLKETSLNGPKTVRALCYANDGDYCR